jgi:hypothetical protein
MKMNVSRTLNAFSTGVMAVVSARTMWFSVSKRPNTRMTRNTRIMRTMLIGIGIGPSATNDKLTTIRSRTFQPFIKNSRSQWQNRFNPSSIVNMVVNA